MASRESLIEILATNCQLLLGDLGLGSKEKREEPKTKPVSYLISFVRSCAIRRLLAHLMSLVRKSNDYLLVLYLIVLPLYFNRHLE